VFGRRRHGNGAAFRTAGTRPCITRASKSRSLLRSSDLTNIMASIHVLRPTLDVDHADWPIRRRAEGWGAFPIAFGAPDMTLTCTSMPRWSDGNPIKVP
jgi:hypothetical protein